MTVLAVCSWVKGIERNFFFLTALIQMILHTHPSLCRSVNTRLCLIYRSQDTSAVYTTDACSYEKTMRSVKRYVTDAFYERLVWECRGVMTHTHTVYIYIHTEAYGSTFQCLPMCLSVLSFGLVTCLWTSCWLFSQRWKDHWVHWPSRGNAEVNGTVEKFGTREKCITT